MDRSVLATATMSVVLVGCPALLSDDWRIVTDGAIGNDANGAPDATAGTSSGSLDATLYDSSETATSNGGSSGSTGGSGSSGSSGGAGVDSGGDGGASSGGASSASGGTSASSSGSGSSAGGSSSTSGSSGTSTGSSGSASSSGSTSSSSSGSSGSDSGGCATGQTLCSGTCANLQTDSNNCGTCARTCQNGACQAAVCPPYLISINEGGPWVVAVDSTNVYWTDENAGTVMQAPAGGGTAVTVGDGTKRALRHRGGLDVRLLGRQGDGPEPHGWTVMKTSIGVNAPVTIASNQVCPVYLAVDSTSVYWTTFYGGTIGKAPIAPDAGSATTLASGQSYPLGIVVAGSTVYWGTTNGGTIVSASVNGGTPVTLATGLAAPAGLAADETNLYWTNSGGNSIATLPLDADGGTSPTVVTTGLSQPGILAIDATNFYFINGGDDTVRSAPKSGGPSSILGRGGNNLGGVAVDSTSLYWTDQDNGSINKLTPK